MDNTTKEGLPETETPGDTDPSTSSPGGGQDRTEHPSGARSKKRTNIQPVDPDPTSAPTTAGRVEHQGQKERTIIRNFDHTDTPVFAGIVEQFPFSPPPVAQAKASSAHDINNLKENVFYYPNKRLKEEHNIFQGGIGSKENHVAVAIKLLDENYCDIAYTKREIEHTSVLPVDNHLVAYRAHGTFKYHHRDTYFLAIELCQKDSLKTRVEQGQVPSHDFQMVLLHACCGLCTLHDKKIVHRDVEPSNLLLSLDGRHWKISDYALCKKFSNEMSISKSEDYIGTEGWGSPEHYIMDGGRGKMAVTSDVFSLGLLFYFVLSGGKHAFGSNRGRWRVNIEDGKNMDLSGITGGDKEVSLGVINKMLQRQPESRPRVSEVMKHPFFWDDERKLSFLCKAKPLLKQIQSDLQPSPVMSVTAAERAMFEKIDKSKDVLGESDNWSTLLKVEAETEELRVGYQRVYEKAGYKQKSHYRHNSVFDLLCLVRNIKEHYKDENEPKLQKVFKCEQDIYKYFSARFPKLLCVVYNAMLQVWKEEGEGGVETRGPSWGDLKTFFTQPAVCKPLSPRPT